MKIKLIAVLFLLAVVFLLPVSSLAAANVSPGVAGGLIPCGNNVNGVKDACTLCHFVVGFQNLVNFMLKLVITMAFVGIFASGVMYIISSGDDGMMTNAKKALTASLVGFGIVMGAWLIVNVTIWVLGANIGVATGQNWYDFYCSTGSSANAAYTTSAKPAPKKLLESCDATGSTSAFCADGTWAINCPGGGKHINPDNCEDGLYCCDYPAAPKQKTCSEAGGMCSTLGGNACPGSSTVIPNSICAGGAACCTKITP